MDRQMNIALRKTLDQIGVKHSLKGYGYIISAVEKCLENRSKLISIIKGLYTEIAEENSDTVWRVERSIRHAIEVTWTNGNTNAINKIFWLHGFSGKRKADKFRVYRINNRFCFLVW